MFYVVLKGEVDEIRLVSVRRAGLSRAPYYVDSGVERVELSGQWFYRKENEARVQGVEGFLAQKLPTGLFRAAILPLRGFSMKGVLWYQGESNTGNPERYDDKFAAMMEAWRTELDAELPVICVELADYIDPINGHDQVGQPFNFSAPPRKDAPMRCRIRQELRTPFELHPQNKKIGSVWRGRHRPLLRSSRLRDRHRRVRRQDHERTVSKRKWRNVLFRR